jgi:hypothetical protein
VLGRRKTTQTQPPAAPDGPGKNHPTPKRRTAEAARKQPLVPASRAATGKGGKGGGKAARQAAREQRLSAREHRLAGEERYLLGRDRGPVRRFARDYVDARWNLGELLLPVMVVVLVLSFVGGSFQRQNPGIFGAVLAVTYTMVVMSAVDALLMSLRLKRALRERFGQDAAVKGISWYAVMRAFQIRRTRVPRPVVKRGQPPA